MERGSVRPAAPRRAFRPEARSPTLLRFQRLGQPCRPAKRGRCGQPQAGDRGGARGGRKRRLRSHHADSGQAKPKPGRAALFTPAQPGRCGGRGRDGGVTDRAAVADIKKQARPRRGRKHGLRKERSQPASTPTSSKLCVAGAPQRLRRSMVPASRVGRVAGSRGSRGAKKMAGSLFESKTIIHTTTLNSNHHHHGGYWIPSLLYRKHWSQIYVKYAHIY